MSLKKIKQKVGKVCKDAFNAVGSAVSGIGTGLAALTAKARENQKSLGEEAASFKKTFSADTAQDRSSNATVWVGGNDKQETVQINLKKRLAEPKK